MKFTKLALFALLIGFMVFMAGCIQGSGEAAGAAKLQQTKPVAKDTCTADSKTGKVTATVNGMQQTYSSSCYSTKGYNSYSCDGTKLVKKDNPCPDGRWCSNGGCMLNSCTKSGNVVTVKNQDGTKTYADKSCIANVGANHVEAVVESSCDGYNLKQMTSECGDLRQPWKYCDRNKIECSFSIVSCTNTNEGISYVNAAGSTFEEKNACEYSSNQLRTFKCSGNNAYTWSLDSCPNGQTCLDAKCIPYNSCKKEGTTTTEVNRGITKTYNDDCSGIYSCDGTSLKVEPPGVVYSCAEGQICSDGVCIAAPQ